MKVVSYQIYKCPLCSKPGVIRVYEDLTVHFECLDFSCGYGFNTFPEVEVNENDNDS